MDELFSFFFGTVLAPAALVVVVHLVAKVIEWRHPPIGKFLEIDGARVHYFERGSGSAVLFLHGIATMLQDFTLSEALDTTAEQNRAMAVDRPGCGYSTRPRSDSR